MKILLSTIFWGKEYLADFADYSLASLMASKNLPLAANTHRITLVILTEAKLVEAFKLTDIYQKSCDIVHYEFHAFENYGISPHHIPGSYDVQKYSFLSTCQNIVIGLSQTYDLHVFNYADFIWADGSLVHLIDSFETNDIFALLGFCIPVAEKKVKPVLHAMKSEESLQIAPHQAVNIALDHLHSEARLRNWHGSALSRSPSYLYWEIPDEGVVLRTFHPTLLAAAPTRSSAIYNRGILQGTLDSSFAAEIYLHEKTMMATDSEAFFAFSMHHTLASSKSRKGKKEALQAFIKDHVSAHHLHSFKQPILLKKKSSSDVMMWENCAAESLRDVMFIFETECMDNAAHHKESPILTTKHWAQEELSVHHFVAHRMKPMVLYYTKNILKRWIDYLRA